MSERAIFGDFQTPDAVARAAMRVAVGDFVPDAIVEPTVGLGSVLAAAASFAPRARLLGFDINEAHLEAARERFTSPVRLERADVFAFDFESLADSLDGPTWLVGNPPWVTSSAMPGLGGANLPKKSVDGLSRGLDARTGKANFDVTEWILTRLVVAFRHRNVRGAFLVKTQVARRMVERAAKLDLPLFQPTVRRIDAMRAFGASVDACLFSWSSVADPASDHPRDARLFASLDATEPSSRFGIRDASLVMDLDAFERVSAYLGLAAVPFRSGMKHDAADVFELTLRDGALVNGLGERVDVETEVRFPLKKSADLGKSAAPVREIVLPQRVLGDDTEALRTSAPRAFAYLESYDARLAARRSSVYRDRPRFAVFGIGPYAFAPYKVAVSGLAKRPSFVVVGPVDRKPTLLDDTSYFVPCDDASDADALCRTLSSTVTRDVLAALVYREAKRPLTKDLLMRLDFAKLAEAAHARAEIASEDLVRVRAFVAAAKPSDRRATTRATNARGVRG